MDDREQLIRDRAYAIWQREGCPAGREREHWQTAAREIDEELGPVGGMAAPIAAPKTGEASAAGKPAARKTTGAARTKKPAAAKEKTAAAGAKKPTTVAKEKASGKGAKKKTDK